MAYFDDPDHVREYLDMLEGYENSIMIDLVERFVPAGSSILELGMGPGKDLDELSEKYRVTGSDSSEVFLELYRKNHPDADLIQLDAVTLETDRQFNAIYSNKVLQHLSKEELALSLRRQLDIVRAGGYLIHTLWKGEGEEFIEDLRFTYYYPEVLAEQLDSAFPRGRYGIVEMSLYTEMEQDDSFSIIIRKV